MNNGYAPSIGNPPPILDATYKIFDSSTQILRFPKNLLFRVYYLEAPLSILSDALVNAGVISSLVELNIFHSGIGFQCVNEKRPFEFTFDYNIIDGLNIMSLVPTIVDNDVIWNNAAKPFIGNFIDRDYWNHSTYIATITPDQLILIQEWIIRTWVPENPNYVLFSGVASNNILEERRALFNPIMRSADCFDFAYAMIQFMKNSLRIRIDYPVVPNLTIAALVGSSPASIVPVDFEANQEEIVAFYQSVIDFFNNPNISNVFGASQFNTFSTENDIFSVIQLYAEFYQNLNTIFVFAYHPDGSPGYWLITNPTVFIDYVQIDIKRSFRAVDTSGQLVTDAYSDLIPTCLEFNVGGSTSWLFFIIFLIIFIIIIMAIVVYFVYYRKRKMA